VAPGSGYTSNISIQFLIIVALGSRWCWMVLHLVFVLDGFCIWSELDPVLKLGDIWTE
jgi:hypothetical protein